MGTFVTIVISCINLLGLAGLAALMVWTIKVSNRHIRVLTELANEQNESLDETCLMQRLDTKEVLHRLKDRKDLMNTAVGEGSPNDQAAYALQVRIDASLPFRKQGKAAANTSNNDATFDGIAAATHYRLGITDLFVEKAQFYLEHRAGQYKKLGYLMYTGAMCMFGLGAILAVVKMLTYDPPKIEVVGPGLWPDLLARFILAFTGYGFIVLTGVAFARGARACLDQQERLLAKRHSLRQGRLYLHLAGGHVTIDEMERAFNWNHSQSNAFTHMPTDTKAPWGAVLEEIVRITPELVQTGVAAGRQAAGTPKTVKSGGKTTK